MREAVVFVHGIWMQGTEMRWLRKRVAACGYRCYQFRYHSLLRSPRDNAQKLDRFLAQIDADIIHLVAHSLGGVVVLHLFDAFVQQRPGSVVMLATPLRGSTLAAHMHQRFYLRPLIGRSVERGVLGGMPRWKGTRNLGVIAGDRGIGMGMLALGGLPRPHDGTVRIKETQIPELTDHLIVPYSHFTMLLSAQVAQQVCQFLKTGSFTR